MDAGGRSATTTVFSPPLDGEKATLEQLTETLLGRIDRLVEGGKEPISSATGVSVAIRELLYRNDALEQAVREIAREVERVSAQLDASR